MPRTTLTPQTIVSAYPTLPVSALALDWTLTAADVANGNQFVFTGNEIILWQNSGASPHTVTLTSAADDLRRTGDITAYSVGAGLIGGIMANKLPGWYQSDGKYYLSANHAEIKFAILRPST